MIVYTFDGVIKVENASVDVSSSLDWMTVLVNYDKKMCSYFDG